MRRLIPLLLSVTALLLPLSGSAHEYAFGQLSIAHPWARPTPPGVMIGAGYMTIHNGGDQTVTLVSVQSPRAARVTLHQSRMDNGLMRMEALERGLTVPAGGRIELKPHGYHLMLEQLRSPLREGERLPLTLTFEGGLEVSVELAVEPLDGAAEPMAPVMDKDGMGNEDKDNEDKGTGNRDHGEMNHGQMHHNH
ncbi:copper chaperone PCu(A)C [Marinobacter sp. SS21]|uniref:copper chaperone PCu(A)C n=1 Tax=Marinobacter sp. SS21 TaxID=2979460 RepID=UPI00232FB759|nr:copper chaperone PCu(A)C [Marinobacter sp. SS21]MDC0662723.1 copper chaperone PCu(A)C [Marinobacter sp. SS21]